MGMKANQHRRELFSKKPLIFSGMCLSATSLVLVMVFFLYFVSGVEGKALKSNPWGASFPGGRGTISIDNIRHDQYHNEFFFRGGSDRPLAPSTLTGSQGQSWRSPATAASPVSGKQSSNIKVSSQRNLENNEKQHTKEVIDTFLTRQSRQSFISRVYAILTGQLLLTALSVIGFSKNRALAYWFLTKGKVAVYLAMMVSVWTCIKMGTDPDSRRKSPAKWNLLGMFTASEAFTVGLVSSLFGVKTLISAFLATSTATAGITLYTLLQNNPKYDLSQWGSGLSSMLLILTFYTLLRLIFGNSFLPMDQMLYSGIGAVLFSLYLAHHTRLIVSGKHSKYQLNEKDYVYGAMTLFLDIINIFLRMIQLFDEMERRRD